MLDRRRFLELAAFAAASGAGGIPALARGRVQPFDSAGADASAMALGLKRGQVTAIQLVDQAISRLNQVNGRLNAANFLYLDEARAEARSRAAGAALAGLPSFSKDITPERGRAYTEGSRAYAGRIATSDSGAIAALKASGLILLGRSTSPEFGLLPTTEPLLGGPTRNPWNSDISCGGSSGGSAALVAAGVVPFAHASDGGGSIRIPASVNGLVGLKPSRGRMAGEEGRARVTDLSVNCCVSRTVRDTAAWFAATEARKGGFKPVGLVTGPGRRALRIGLRAEGSAGLPDADVMAVFQASGDLLRRLGHRLVDVPTPYDVPAVSAAFQTLWGAGAAADVQAAGAYLGREPGSDDLEPATFAFARLAAGAGKSGLEKAVGVLEAMTKAYVAQFDAIDLLMTPVLGTPPPRIGHLGPEVPFPQLLDRLERYVGYTPIENAAGVPAIALPMGMSSSGLPVGMQFAVPPGQERMLLELAYAIEAAQPWASLKPAIWAA